VRLVFCGTPQFAIPTLESLLASPHSVELVLTQPDRVKGRDSRPSPPPVKQLASQHGIPVLQPEKIKNNLELRTQLEALQPDAIIVVAYGRIIPGWMLTLPRWGNINVHGSLLPKYRGAAPIQWAVANGEVVTGATTMRLDEGLDTGDIFEQCTLPIAPDQTAEELFPLLAKSGAKLLLQTLQRLEAGTITAVPQDHSQATLAPILEREDALVDFNRSATEIYNRWRGFQPWPGAYTFFHGKKLTLHRVRLAENKHLPPAELAVDHNRLFVGAGSDTVLELEEVQLEGKKRLPVAEFLRGASLHSREHLGQP
jgi:methionyl-tRNA formyltransferase